MIYQEKSAYIYARYQELQNQLDAVTPPGIRDEVQAELNRLMSTALSGTDSYRTLIRRMTENGSPYVIDGLRPIRMNVEDQGRMYIAPVGTPLHRGADLAAGWKEIGTISDTGIPCQGITRSWLDEPVRTIPGRTSHWTLRTRNKLEFRNMYRLVAGTSHGLPSLIHNGKKPRKHA